MDEQLHKHREEVRQAIRESLHRWGKIIVYTFPFEGVRFLMSRCGVPVNPQQIYYLSSRGKFAGIPHDAIIIWIRLWDLKPSSELEWAKACIESSPDRKLVYTDTDYWI